ncbi:peroxide stress protein YaaA [Leucobacter weissii]|uniref:Peroxide stress protein YaaA n=1 Tax=Leucobacter weissii TaxID=1983706 RepID=A0A939MLZ1_9MICO|nr:peroxide stress protein YaaA [Leucobacter weissii]MBO1903001.1 peroxide stress protein YaaA [Leucobacter weissii]
MHVLLPPSETKRTGGGGSFDPADLSRAGDLGPARAEVRRALEEVSADEDLAARALGLGVKNRDEAARNLRLAGSGVLPAIERYTGVLYDAIDIETLDAAARQWVDAHVSVQSALFGLISAADPVPAYRLSAGSRLPGLGAPLKRVWGEAHRGLEWNSLGWVLDLRSKDYAALNPLPPGRGSVLSVVQRGPGGEVRALNHFNKAAKGDLVRRLASSSVPLSGADELIGWGRAHGLELLAGPGDDEFTLVTEIGAPARSR